MTKRKLELWTVCNTCDECGYEESVHRVQDLRTLPNGEFICDGCFDNLCAEDFERMGLENWISVRWSDLPSLPDIGIIGGQL